jgi:hypothetical protein
MKNIRGFIILLLVLLLILNGGLYTAIAHHRENKQKRWYQKIFDRDDDDHHDDDHKDRKRYRRRDHDDDHDGENLKAVSNPSYKENCGACHFAYQPGLLPSSSWKNILGGLDDHFGEFVDLDPETQEAISSYLEANAAEQSSAKRAVKIMRSLGSTTPMRITDIPYIKHKHHEISASAFNRQTIGSFSNCDACHKRAEEGVYDDDFVDIPR